MNASKRKIKKQKKILSILLLIAVILALILGILLIIRRFSEPKQELTAEQPETTEPTETIPETEPPETIPETTEETLPAGTVTGISLSFYYASMQVEDAAIMPVVQMQPEDALDLSERWETSDETVAVVDEEGKITAVGEGNCSIRVTSVSNPEVFAEVHVTVYPEGEEIPIPTEAYDEETRKDIQVINGVTYVQGVMLVNKTYPLPSSYYTGGLTSEANEAFSALRAAASEEAGLYLFSHSDFRSYHTQTYVYNDYCNQYGKEAADTFSARPGYSEHQTGLCIDVNFPGDSFNDTPEAVWLEENCWRFGFIIRFPREKEEITGYKYESWHIRYVGKDLAKKIYDSGLCLEEYLNVTSKYP